MRSTHLMRFLCFVKDGGIIREARPFLELLVDVIVEGSLENQALCLLAMQKTVTAVATTGKNKGKGRRSSCGLELTRFGGFEVLKFLLRQSLEGKQGELLEIALETLDVLPYEANAIQDANLARFMNQFHQQVSATTAFKGEMSRRIMAMTKKISDRIIRGKGSGTKGGAGAAAAVGSKSSSISTTAEVLTVSSKGVSNFMREPAWK